MSSGVVHHKYYLKFWIVAPIIAVFTGTILYAVAKNPLFSLYLFGSIIGGYGLGNYADPDFDLISITFSEGRMMRELGILGKFLFIYWIPYSFICQIFGGHRSAFSHWPFLSTFFRLMYFLIPFWIFFIKTKQDLWDWEILIFVGLWIGLGIADTVHWILDLWPKKE